MKKVKIGHKEISSGLVILTAIATTFWLSNQFLWRKVLKKQIEEKDVKN